MSSVSRKQETVHADASASCGGEPAALCWVFGKGRLQFEGAHKKPRTRNPRAVSCPSCLRVLSERTQLYAIMLASWAAAEKAEQVRLRALLAGAEQEANDKDAAEDELDAREDWRP